MNQEVFGFDLLLIVFIFMHFVTNLLVMVDAYFICKQQGAFNESLLAKLQEIYIEQCIVRKFNSSFYETMQYKA